MISSRLHYHVAGYSVVQSIVAIVIALSDAGSQRSRTCSRRSEYIAISGRLPSNQAPDMSLVRRHIDMLQCAISRPCIL
jgi:hypothetical protein